MSGGSAGWKIGSVTSVLFETRDATTRDLRGYPDWYPDHAAYEVSFDDEVGVACTVLFDTCEYIQRLSGIPVEADVFPINTACSEPIAAGMQAALAMRAGLPPCDLLEKRVCSNCSKKKTAGADFPQCSRCRSVVYCSSSCQSAAYKSHRPACKANANFLATAGKSDARKEFKRKVLIEFLVSKAGFRTAVWGPAYGAAHYLVAIVERAHKQRDSLSALAANLCDEEGDDIMDTVFGQHGSPCLGRESFPGPGSRYC